MSGQVIVEEALKPASEILSNISFSIDEGNRLVDTSLFGFFHRRAVYSEGTGCTLLSADHQQLQRKLEVAEANKPDSELAWPQGAASARVKNAVSSNWLPG